MIHLEHVEAVAVRNRGDNEVAGMSRNHPRDECPGGGEVDAWRCGGNGRRRPQRPAQPQHDGGGQAMQVSHADQ